jgi:hypothetical protein
MVEPSRQKMTGRTSTTSTAHSHNNGSNGPLESNNSSNVRRIEVRLDDDPTQDYF